MQNSGKIVLIALAVVLGLVLAGLLGVVAYLNTDEYSLVIDMKGDEVITLEYGSEFVDPGAEAWLYNSLYLQDGEQITNITVENPVDVNKVGTYLVTYRVEYQKDDLQLKHYVQRTVHIVDTKAPTITLVTDPNHYTYPGHAYKEEGFTATDDYDGDLTDRVVCTEENGVVTYCVKDLSGNETVVTRPIVYADPDAPVLSLQGSNPMTILVGMDFVDPGVIAWDGCDGMITEKVVSSEILIDPYVPGNYTIVYTVFDKAGNMATVERQLEVVGATNPETVTPSGKVIYLTFDDGPGPYTDRLLDTLAKYNVKATFFVVDTGAKYYNVLKRIVKEGHSIAVHCTNHVYADIYASEDAYFADLENMKNIIYEQTGVSTQLIRFPGGSSNTASKFNPGIMTRLTKAVRARGYQYFDWNVDSNDAGGAKDSATVANNVITGCSNRRVSVVLQHDIKSYSVDAVEEIIVWGLANGYTFMALDVTSPHAHHGIKN